MLHFSKLLHCIPRQFLLFISILSLYVACNACHNYKFQLHFVHGMININTHTHSLSRTYSPVNVHIIHFKQIKLPFVIAPTTEPVHLVLCQIIWINHKMSPNHIDNLSKCICEHIPYTTDTETFRLSYVLLHARSVVVMRHSALQQHVNRVAIFWL